MISVFCASRLLGLGDAGFPFLFNGLASVLSQEGATVDEVVVGLDAGVPPPVVHDARVRFVNSDGFSQAKAVTAALREVKGDIICGLEDDDEWSVDKLATQLPWLQQGYNFVSGSVCEVHYSTGQRMPNRPNAFISSWVMTRECLATVGAYFDEAIAYHVDCEWLGRLNQHPEFKRMHVVEMEAMPPLAVVPPLNVLGEWSAVRGIENGPLVRRTVGYKESRGLECGLEAGAKLKLQADAETLFRRHGDFPWLWLLAPTLLGGLIG